MSLGIFSVVPPTESCALRSTQPLKVSTKVFFWDKGGRCVWLTNYHPCSAETSRKSGALTYPEPLGPPRPVAGDLYLYLYSFQRLSISQSTWFRRGESRNKSPVTPPGIDPGTVRLVAQCLNHYTTTDPSHLNYMERNVYKSFGEQEKRFEIKWERKLLFWWQFLANVACYMNYLHCPGTPILNTCNIACPLSCISHLDRWIQKNTACYKNNIHGT